MFLYLSVILFAEKPWTETPLNRAPPGQRLPLIEPSPEQRDPLERDPPQTETPWTETACMVKSERYASYVECIFVVNFVIYVLFGREYQLYLGRNSFLVHFFLKKNWITEMSILCCWLRKCRLVKYSQTVCDNTANSIKTKMNQEPMQGNPAGTAHNQKCLAFSKQILNPVDSRYKIGSVSSLTTII